MAKFLLLLAVIGAVVLLIKNYQRSLARHDSERADTPVAPATEDMVRCARCGVHMPRSESILSQGQFFCSDEHRRLGPPQGRG